MTEPIRKALLGYAKSGKSSYFYYLINKKFLEEYTPTIGASFHVYQYRNNKFQIWDTAGDEKYNSLISLYTKNAKIAMLFYDITNPKSFDVAKKEQIRVKLQNNDDCMYMLIGCKSDLKQNRKVSYEEGEKYASTIKAPYMEVSSLTGEGVFESFEIMCREYCEYNGNKEQNKKLQILSHTKKNNKSCIII